MKCVKFVRDFLGYTQGSILRTSDVAAESLTKGPVKAAEYVKKAEWKAAGRPIRLQPKES